MSEDLSTFSLARLEDALTEEHGKNSMRAGRIHAEIQRRKDDEQALVENDEQRDYAEERFNEQLMREE